MEGERCGDENRDVLKKGTGGLDQDKNNLQKKGEKHYIKGERENISVHTLLNLPLFLSKQNLLKEQNLK